MRAAVEGQPSHCYCTRADVWGDGRDEVIVFGSHTARIYANSRPSAISTHYNQTLYPGMQAGVSCRTHAQTR